MNRSHGIDRRGQIHFVKQGKEGSGLQAISYSQTSILINQIINPWGGEPDETQIIYHY